jgi:hypothetical protein
LWHVVSVESIRTDDLVVAVDMIAVVVILGHDYVLLLIVLW